MHELFTLSLFVLHSRDTHLPYFWAPVKLKPICLILDENVTNEFKIRSISLFIVSKMKFYIVFVLFFVVWEASSSRILSYIHVIYDCFGVLIFLFTEKDIAIPPIFECFYPNSNHWGFRDITNHIFIVMPNKIILVNNFGWT